jgi:hypothetical protein
MWVHRTQQVLDGARGEVLFVGDIAERQAHGEPAILFSAPES